MKNYIVIGGLTHIVFDASTCTFAQSNKQDKAPLLPEITQTKPKNKVKKVLPFHLQSFPSMDYAFNSSSSQKKRYNRKRNQTKKF